MRERLQSRASRAVAGEPKGDSIQLPHRDAIERATGFDFSHVRAYHAGDGVEVDVNVPKDKPKKPAPKKEAPKKKPPPKKKKAE